MEIEESRFAAAQTRATALLAVTGVLAGIGGSILAGLKAHDYSFLILVLVFLLAATSLGSLLWTAFLAMGSLKVQPEAEDDHPAEARLAQFSDDLPLLLEKPAQEAAQSLLPLLARQTRRIHQNTEDVQEGFKQATRVLAVAVLAGLTMSFLVIFARASQPQEFRLVGKQKQQVPTLARATLKEQ